MFCFFKWRTPNKANSRRHQQKSAVIQETFQVDMFVQTPLCILTIYSLAIIDSGTTTTLSKTQRVWEPETDLLALKICRLFNCTPQTTDLFIFFITPCSHITIPVSFTPTTLYPPWLTTGKWTTSYCTVIFIRGRKECHCWGKTQL